MKRRLKRIAIAFLVPIIIIGSDLAARYWLALNTPPTYGQYRLGHPPAYASSPYYSADFIHEMSAFLSSTNDFSGRWYNRTNGERRTTGQPDHAASSIYLFGSSTAMNPEVPDGYTIASFLQRLMPAYRVVNLAAVGQWSRLQVLLLKTLPLKLGDIVIFYDGIADATIGFQGDTARRDATLPGKFCNWLSGLANLGVVQLYCELADRGTPLLDQHPPDSLGQEFEQAQLEALAYCRERGVAFYHFLHPLIWSRELSPSEQGLSENYRMLPRGERAYIAEAWLMLEDVTRRVSWSVSLYHAVDDLRASGVEVYVDYDHMTERGNAVIARAIYDQLTIY